MNDWLGIVDVLVGIAYLAGWLLLNNGGRYSKVSNKFLYTSAVIAKVLLVVGIISIVVGIASFFIPQSTFRITVTVVVPVAMPLFLLGILIKKNKTVLTFGIALYALFMIIVIIMTIFTLLKAAESPRIELSESKITIKCDYGLSFDKDNICGIELLHLLPDIDYRANGSYLEPDIKGEFVLKDGSHCRIFVDESTPPFILIKCREGNIYINQKDSLNTVSIYNDITNSLRTTSNQ